MDTVRAWRESVILPTYEVGKAEKNPIFLEKRVYQGSSGAVYPYPVIESIADVPVPHEWHAVWIENEYLKVMILPELGGRVQMAYDKIRQRHFVYYNHVIKPALVGLLGPWISGGIEFNWPQHHRPSTYMPVDCSIVENPDGSVTVWINERERMFHQCGQAGFTLRPGCAYLEIQGRVSNPTELPQTFLWWANPAVEVNDAYQSVFPQDVNAVFDHGKRAVSSFPIATGTYYKMDYSAGVDISNYKNIFVPTSYMVAHSDDNFEGGYENDTQAGMLHVASRHYAPGKKQWTWGNGDFGRAWDRALTDPVSCAADVNGIPQPSASGYRPYIELMAGVYTENQPDFSWLMPGEKKTFVQYFMPYRELGIVKQASKDLLLNVEPQGDGAVVLKLYATSAQHIELILRSDAGNELFRRCYGISPMQVNTETIVTGDTPFSELSVEISGTSSLYWHAVPAEDLRPIPESAQPALKPHDIKTNDQLFLTGLHLEQYRHATWSALDYYEEALRRDPDDTRCLNQLGLWYLRRGRFDKAEPLLRRCIRVWQRRNPNPYDGEPLYNLALCLKYMDCLDEAYEWACKSTWNAAWQHAGHLLCAQIDCCRERYSEALEHIEKSLITGWHDSKARALKAWILEYLHRSTSSETVRFVDESLRVDPFCYGCMLVRYDCERECYADPSEMYAMMHNELNNYHELALDLMAAGFRFMASRVLKHAVSLGIASSLTHYYLAWCETADGYRAEHYQNARQTAPDYCFPNRMEDVVVLQKAMEENADDARAPYLLGLLYYDKRQHDLAAQLWERSASLDPQFPTVHRNLALYYFNKQHDAGKAVACMEKAFALDTTDARIFMELDQLYKRLGRPHDKRLALMQQHLDMVETRDDLKLEYATLLNLNGLHEEAIRFIDSHTFHVWEGGEGKVPAQFQLARTELAKKMMHEQPAAAIALLEACFTYPHNLGEGKLHGAQESDFHYFMGKAYLQLGQTDKARACFGKATLGPTEPAAAMYYNDAKPEKIFYQGLALAELARLAEAAGEKAKTACHNDGVTGINDEVTHLQEEATRYRNEANGRFYKLLNYGKQHLFDEVVMDYFAVSLPDLQIWEGDLNRTNQIHCKFMMALGYYGLGNKAKAMQYLQEVSELDVNHLGIFALRSFMQ